jgi:hypothetical protein
MLFELFYSAVIAILILLTIVNGFLVIRLRRELPEVYTQLGSPGPFFFATGAWLTSFRFTKFLLTKESSNTLVTRRSLLWLSRIVAALYIALLLCLLGGVLAAAIT